jgi:N-acetylglucosaminyl-diphospho-decaprenol L-rhamnosyltransferase
MSSTGSHLVSWRMRAELLYYRKHHGAVGAWSVMLLEKWWNQLRAIRNSFSRSEEARAKKEESRATVALMKQAWSDTHRGQISPPRPW